MHALVDRDTGAISMVTLTEDRAALQSELACQAPNQFRYDSNPSPPACYGMWVPNWRNQLQVASSRGNILLGASLDCLFAL